MELPRNRLELLVLTKIEEGKHSSNGIVYSRKISHEVVGVVVWSEYLGLIVGFRPFFPLAAQMVVVDGTKILFF